MEFEGFAAATTQGRSSNSPFGSSSWRLPTALLVGAPSNGHADVLITGDSDLLALNPFRGVPIITPAGLRAGCLTLKHPALGMHFNVGAQPAEIPVRLRRFAEIIGAAAWQSAKAIFSGRYATTTGLAGEAAC